MSAYPHPYRADVAHLADLGARVELSGSTGAGSSGLILDSGRHGLEFFRTFGPSYATLTGTEFDFEHAFAHRYDEHATVGFGALRADRDRFTVIGSGLTDIEINLRNRADSVFGSWHGGSAESARSRLGALLSAAGELRDRFARLGHILDEVVELADRACYAKAEGVSRLYAIEVGGRDPEEIDFLVDVAPRLRAGQAGDDEVATAARLCDLTPALVIGRTPVALVQVASAVDRWLSETFAPAYEAKAARFDEICAAADDSLAEAWNRLSAVLSEVSVDQSAAVFPTEPAAAPTPAPPTAVPPANPATVAPGPAQPTGAGGGDVGETAAQPERLGPGEAAGADTMTPQAFRGPVPAGTTTPSTGPSAGNNTFFGGVPFLPGAGAQGGGDQQYRRLGLPTAEGAFSDTEIPATDEATAIGAPDDAALYNDEAMEGAETELAEEKPDKSIAELLDDDLW